MDKAEKLTYVSSVRKNPPYPKVRLVCGQIERIIDKNATPDRMEPRPIPLRLSP